MSKTPEEYFKKYFNLKKEIQNEIETVIVPGEVTAVEPIVESLKVATDPSGEEQVNDAHVAIDSAHISGTLGMLKAELAAANLALPPRIEEWIGVSRDIEQKAEAASNERSIGEEASELYLTATECQSMAQELKTMAEELKDAYESDSQEEAPSEIVEVISTSVKEKVENFFKRLAGKVRDFGADLRNAVRDLPDKIAEKGRQLAKKMAPLLRKVVEKLQQFMAALVGAMFSFAAWVQGIAAEKNFQIQTFAIKFPSQVFEVVTVGIFPITIPKFSTPELTVTFSPVASKPKANGQNE